MSFWRRVRAIRNPGLRKPPPALVSSGGLAAPVTPIYGSTGTTGPTTNFYSVMPTFNTSTTTPGYFSSSSASVSIYPSDYSSAPIEDLGVAIEPIVGLRCWNIDHIDDLPILTSYNNTGWPHRKPIHAICGSDVFAEHEVPSETCHCGIYAWNKDLIEQAIGKLYGEVFLWGDVLICPSGYRAEFAYPKSLTIASKETRAVKRVRDGLEEAYGVPVTIVDPANLTEKEDVTGFGSSNPFLSS